MKKALFVLAAILLSVSITSCEKWDGDKKDGKKGDDSYYYSDNFKESSGTILSIDIETIKVLYSVFFYEGKNLRYKLVVQDDTNQESKKYAAYEEGDALVDDDLNITFVPENNPTDRYYGYFENEKKNYKVVIPTADSRELNFVLK